MSSVFMIENKEGRSRFLWLFYILVVKAVVSLLLIASYNVHLAPDEAQYWTWSQHLDWGYFSKPPAIAWQIWLTTTIFGNTEFGIRFGAVVIAFFLPLIVYAIATHARLTPRAAFWAGLVMAFSPLGVFLSFAASTDGGAILFMTLAILTMVRGMERFSPGPNYPMVGLWILFGALYKWTAYLFWPITLLFLIYSPKYRSWSFLWGVLISLVALLPAMYWNATHDFATFKHVAGNISGGNAHGNFWDFLGAQVGVLSPIFFILLVASYFYVKNRIHIYLAMFPFMVLMYFFMALFKKIQPNWAIFLYPAGTVLIAWLGVERLRLGRVWLHLGFWLAFFISLFGIAIPVVQEKNLYPVPYKLNPFRASMGWNHLQAVLYWSGFDPQHDFLFGDKYQNASVLSFYSPGKQQAYFFNLNGDRKNQFSYWPSMDEEQVGRDGYFVVLENKPPESIDYYASHYTEALAPYFKRVEFKGGYPLFKVHGMGVKHAVVFKCSSYLGGAPQDPNSY